LTIYCASKAGHLIKSSWSDILPNASKTDVILFGPGIGRHPDIKFLLQKTIALQKPTVIDADALHAFALSKIKAKQTLVLTPHIGEMAVLTGSAIPDNHTERKKIAAKYALENNLILVLKSHRTIVTDGKQMYEETAGNPGMATGGSGDVLAGTIASFLLMPDQLPFINTIRAVHSHSLSGDLAAKRNSKRYLIASDIIENYGSILSLLEKK
jgi:NAD(P)H-hydrate epimerase